MPFWDHWTKIWKDGEADFYTRGGPEGTALHRCPIGLGMSLDLRTTVEKRKAEQIRCMKTKGHSGWCEHGTQATPWVAS